MELDMMTVIGTGAGVLSCWYAYKQSKSNGSSEQDGASTSQEVSGRQNTGTQMVNVGSTIPVENSVDASVRQEVSGQGNNVAQTVNMGPVTQVIQPDYPERQRQIARINRCLEAVEVVVGQMEQEPTLRDKAVVGQALARLHHNLPRSLSTDITYENRMATLTKNICEVEDALKHNKPMRHGTVLPISAPLFDLAMGYAVELKE